MSVIPTKDVSAIEFFESRDGVWEDHAPQIGVSPAQVAELKELVQQARDAFSAQQLVQSQARAATLAFHNAVAQMRVQGSDMIAMIKNFANLQEQPAETYALAQIPMPAAPTPTPAPGKPESLSFTLNGQGSITLKWKAVNAAPNAGTFFSISRRLPWQTTFTLVGNTGEKRWTDTAIPKGTSNIDYIVQAFRGRKSSSASNILAIQFGSDGRAQSILARGMNVAA